MPHRGKSLFQGRRRQARRGGTCRGRARPESHSQTDDAGRAQQGWLVPMSEQALLLDATLLDAVTAIEQSRRRLAVIVDDSRRVLGTITDGDVRRALLRGATMEIAVNAVMNGSPVVV